MCARYQPNLLLSEKLLASQLLLSLLLLPALSGVACVPATSPTCC
jgi:hypothetical protein